jgi:hypothetical protein
MPIRFDQVGPIRQRGPGGVEVVEDRLVEELVAQAAVDRVTGAVRIGLPGAMKCQAIRLP